MRYTFSDNLNIFAGDGGWFYARLPKDTWGDIRSFAAPNNRGFGSIKVNVTIGKTTWQTSIFPDTKTERYLLFIKKSVRQAEKLDLGTTVTVEVELLT